MIRWHQMRVAGYPTRLEAACAAWLAGLERRHQSIIVDDGVVFRVRGYRRRGDTWPPPPFRADD